MRKTLVVVGHGMVGHRVVELAVSRGLVEEWDVVVHAEEAVPAYDRVALTSWFAGEEDLCLVEEGFFDCSALELRLGDPVVRVDPGTRTVTSASGTVTPYDALVLATGSTPFVPPVPGATGAGRFVYRTLEDLALIRAAAGSGATRGAVVGGGLLGLEAAGALHALGLETTVVEFAPRLMPVQVDEAGGQALRRLVEAMGVQVRLGASTQEVVETDDGLRMRFADGDPLDVDLVVFSAGIRPHDALARDAGLAVGERGGVLVDDACRTSAPDVYAVGECALAAGRCWGLVAPGYEQAAVVVDRLLGGGAVFTGADLSTKLKLLGIDVASFGDAFATTPGALELVWADPVAGRYSKLVVSDDASTLLGGILVGDASRYALLRPLVGSAVPGDPADLVLPERSGAPAVGAAALPDTAQVCSCAGVSKGEIRCAVTEGGCRDVAGVKACTGAGTVCGSCVGMVKELVGAELAARGEVLSRALCEHVDLSRAEVFEVVRAKGIRTWSRFLAEHGRGQGCDVCKPVVASVLASLHGEHVLEGELGTLQDTNDHMLANLQKDGSYSVVPRIPGGEVTPEHLIVLGEVAREHGLYTKITGGQRIDLFGARVEQLPQIWRRLVDAGMESGHAYGKSLRTVKSCVGSTWCRFGVQDSTTLAIELELRYRGLRSPHKVKMAVSGCARECAEARSKDVGVIATEDGWNLYVGGNGGFRPRHADLLLTGVDTDTLVRTIDRFLAFYVRTADRLQRTAGWVEAMEGGLDHLRAVIVDDSLGICADLDAMIAAHVEGYRDEWAAVLEDPDKLTRFTSFVNAPEVPDPSIVMVPERGQLRPARPEEREGGVEVVGPPAGVPSPVLVAGPVLQVVR